MHIKRIRYFFEAIVVYLLYGIFWLLPMPVASNIGGKIAKTFGPLMKIHQRARKNIALALPEIDKEKQEEALIEMWESLGRTIAEFPHIHSMSKQDFLKNTTVVGKEHLINSIEGDKNVICFGGHFGNWETLPKVAAIFDKPLVSAYRHANNPYVDKLIQWNRSTYQKASVRKGTLGSRALLKAIRGKDALGMLLDQKMNNGIPIPFLGRDAMTAPAIAQIALRYDCLIVPATTRRVDGCRFEVVIYPPMTLEKTENEAEDVKKIMTEINQFLEAHIRKYPGQWFWVHQRWPKEKDIKG